MKFIGIDLGWKSQPSRLCCLECIDGQLQLVDLDRKNAIADILTWIDQSVQPYEPAIIAVDAPTLIPNAASPTNSATSTLANIIQDAIQLLDIGVET